MRGKHPLPVCFPSEPRNIPAYAGKTHTAELGRKAKTEHPRVCGENALTACIKSLPCGTSPRMRGKRPYRLHQIFTLRNIPAYAGKTSHRSSRGFHEAEHPRVCGENAGVALVDALVAGTSPRMRGKPNRPHFYGAGERNIPAYAGKTCIRFGRCAVAPEHPRVCGENSPLTYLTLIVSGTSPRMRGKRCGNAPWSCPLRNIPAYAGKTGTFTALDINGEEHPRVCGENDVWADSSSDC